MSMQLGAAVARCSGSPPETFGPYDCVMQPDQPTGILDIPGTGRRIETRNQKRAVYLQLQYLYFFCSLTRAPTPAGRLAVVRAWQDPHVAVRRRRNIDFAYRGVLRRGGV